MAQVRKGTFILHKGDPHLVIDMSHHAMGRGRGILNLKLRNLKTGAVINETFKSQADIQEITVEQKNYQYLYKDENNAYFMDPVTFEQISLPVSIVQDQLEFLKEGETYALYLYEGNPIALNLPKVITLKVTQTPPGVKGDSSSNPTKDAILETGLRIKVPLFIKVGNLVKVNTETKSYIERV